MRELPALFSTPMVQSTLENRKRMTRRIQGLEKINIIPENWILLGCDEHNIFRFFNEKANLKTSVFQRYRLGEKIWVRETFYAYGYWLETGKLTKKTGKIEYKFIDLTYKRGFKYLYETNSDKPNKVLGYNAIKDGVYGWFKRPSLFMPKELTRIWLEITGVRCERLHDISEADAIAEGIEKVQVNQPFEGYKEYYIPGITMGIKPIDSFFSLWVSINGMESMQSNPWVFVYEFKRIEK